MHDVPPSVLGDIGIQEMEKLNTKELTHVQNYFYLVLSKSIELRHSFTMFQVV